MICDTCVKVPARYAVSNGLHVLQCEHGEVIALLGIAYEVGNSLGHLFNESVWLRRCSLQHFFNPFLAKHLALGIFGLV